MAIVKGLQQIKTERPDVLESLEEFRNGVENDELQALVIVGLWKGSNGEVSLKGYWDNRLQLIGALEFAKIEAAQS